VTVSLRKSNIWPVIRTAPLPCCNLIIITQNVQVLNGFGAFINEANAQLWGEAVHLFWTHK